MTIGLRVDVDTYRGTKRGVPTLLKSLAARGRRATFFFSVGPDNMGRHLWRLARPAFLRKMLRSNAPGLYGWDILLRGTLGPGPSIGKGLADVIRAAADEGHEIGLHAWDHHAWQTKIDRWSSAQIQAQLRLGFDRLTDILGRAPSCSAVPAWRCNDRTLRIKQRFPFEFNSDCRGYSIFTPLADDDDDDRTRQPQIPVTLPTYDELVGVHGTTATDYYRCLESLIDPGGLNVLAIHAEVEGIALAPGFERFLDAVGARGHSFAPLGELVEGTAERPECAMEKSSIPGREGWISRQAAVGGP